MKKQPRLYKFRGITERNPSDVDKEERYQGAAKKDDMLRIKEVKPDRDSAELLHEVKRGPARGTYRICEESAVVAERAWHEGVNPEFPSEIERRAGGSAPDFPRGSSSLGPIPDGASPSTYIQLVHVNSCQVGGKEPYDLPIARGQFSQCGKIFDTGQTSRTSGAPRCNIEGAALCPRVDLGGEGWIEKAFEMWHANNDMLHKILKLLAPIWVLSGFIVACLARWEHDQLIGDETENPVYNEIMIREGQRSLPILSATAITSLSGVEPRIIAGLADQAALIYEGILRLLTMDLSPEGTTGDTPGEGEETNKVVEVVNNGNGGSSTVDEALPIFPMEQKEAARSCRDIADRNVLTAPSHLPKQ